jgi:hypothetical protein
LSLLDAAADVENCAAAALKADVEDDGAIRLREPQAMQDMMDAIRREQLEHEDTTFGWSRTIGRV